MISQTRVHSHPASSPAVCVPALIRVLLVVWFTGAAWAVEAGPGTSAPGELVDPDAGPVVGAEPSPPRYEFGPGAEAERPSRGYEFDPAIAKTLPPPPGERPSIIEDAGAVRAESRDTGETGEQTLTGDFQGVGPTGSIPADPILAVGPDHIVQCVNSRFRISTKDGTTVGGATFSNWWGSLVPGQTPIDPWVVYDHFSDRWVMVAISSACSASVAWHLISTSFSSDPTGPWCRWALRADLDGDTDTDDRSDYPRLGLDDTNFYLTTNQFGCEGGFTYSKIRVMNKSQFYSNACDEIEFYDFVDLRNADDSVAFTVQPALTFGSPGRGYLINSYSGSSDLVTLWSITGTWPNPTDTDPVLTQEATVQVGTYSLPPDARQCDDAAPLHTGDARFMNAVYRDGQVFTCHSIAVEGHAAARYLAIDVDDLSLTLDEAICSPGYDYYYPAIIADKDCNIVTVFNRSSPEFDECAGIRFSWRRPSDDGFRASESLKPGEASYVQLDSRDRNRWGDYSGIAVDPVEDGQIWIFSEFAMSPSSDWGTWVGKLKVGPPPPPAVTLELKGVPDPPLVGQPFELRLDVSNQGAPFTGILINLLYVDFQPTVLGVMQDIPISTGSALADLTIFSSPQQDVPPGAIFLTLLYDEATNRIVMFDGLEVSPARPPGSAR